jgi:hypothetical protein
MVSHVVFVIYPHPAVDLFRVHRGFAQTLQIHRNSSVSTSLFAAGLYIPGL